MNKISYVLNEIFTRLQDDQDRGSFSFCGSLNPNNRVQDKKKHTIFCYKICLFMKNILTHTQTLFLQNTTWQQYGKKKHTWQQHVKNETYT